MSSSMQNVLIFSGLIALAAFAYYLLAIQGDGNLNSSMSEANSAESQLFLRQLNQLKSVSLDTSILSDTTFRNLEDQSAPVAAQPVGRSNPFSVNN